MKPSNTRKPYLKDKLWLKNVNLTLKLVSAESEAMLLLLRFSINRKKGRVLKRTQQTQ